MDRKAKGGHLRVGRADEDAVAPRGDELVDEKAEPRRVDAVVVRHQQHRRLRRRGLHASETGDAEAFPFPLERVVAAFGWVLCIVNGDGGAIRMYLIQRSSF